MNILVVCKHSKNNPKSKVCQLINSKSKVNYSWKNNLKPEETKKYDLIVSIGGDGTALSASHYLKDTPLLAVNSSPKTSVGAITTIPSNKLNKKIELIENNNYKIKSFQRIKVKINNKELEPLALNDVFIANQKPYLTSKYTLKINNKEEYQISSGLIFSTGTGSKAWFKSAGGKPFKTTKNIIKMIVREPYKSKLNGITIKKATLKNSANIEVHVPSTLAIDSIREYKLKKGDKISISLSNHPLKKII